MAGLLALDAAADRVDGGEPQAYDVEGGQYPHRGAQHGAQCGGIAAVGIQRPRRHPVWMATNPYPVNATPPPQREGPLSPPPDRAR